MRKIITGRNSSMNIDEEKSKIKIYESQEEWQEEGRRKFGKDISKWRFMCPMCGHIASIEDFKAAGAEEAEECAYQECIGRYTGKGAPKKGDSSGCNWAAYGFLGIPNGGVIVITKKDEAGEHGTHIFDFAPEEVAAE